MPKQTHLLRLDGRAILTLTVEEFVDKVQLTIARQGKFLIPDKEAISEFLRPILTYYEKDKRPTCLRDEDDGPMGVILPSKQGFLVIPCPPKPPTP